MSEQAQNIFKTICGIIDDMGFEYEKQEENLITTGDAHGLTFMTRVSDEKKLVSFVSMINIEINSNMLENVAIAMSKINRGLVFGCFVLQDNASILFQSSMSFHGMTTVGRAALENLLTTSWDIIDIYYDSLEKIAHEHMSLSDIDAILN